LICAPGACFPGGVRQASSSLAPVTLIPQESSAFRSNQLACHVHVFIFFKFMAVKVNIACMNNFIRPRKVVHRIPCFSNTSAKTRSIVSLHFAYICLISFVWRSHHGMTPQRVLVLILLMNIELIGAEGGDSCGKSGKVETLD
jgi:hypothetical protein